MPVRRTALAAARKTAGYSQEGLAERVGVERSTVSRWEVGETAPQPWHRPNLAEALGITRQELGTLLDQGGISESGVSPERLAVSSLSLIVDQHVSSSEPIDDTYLSSIRAQMRQLLSIDAQFGGNEASAQAVRLFYSVHRRIGASPCPAALRRDLYSTAGELAEIAGWLLYDADQQDAVRRMNQEALYYLRWAGDRSLELMTLQNMSMQAEHLRRPSEALNIVQSVMETDHLTPRLESLFLARGAHALAQQGQHSSASRAFEKARALYLNGTQSSDPSWVYWVDDRQFAWFDAMLHTERGDHARTVDIFTEAVATSPKERVRGLYSRTTYLFGSLVTAGDWRQAETIVSQLVPYIREVGSGRTAAILGRTLHKIQSSDAPNNLRDGAVYLKGLLDGQVR
jgi:DNA-binding XRE family transcriptional regulator/tetratricopeptide (TPR) repeat protein